MAKKQTVEPVKLAQARRRLLQARQARAKGLMSSEDFIQLAMECYVREDGGLASSTTYRR